MEIGKVVAKGEFSEKVRNLDREFGESSNDPSEGVPWTIECKSSFKKNSGQKTEIVCRIQGNSWWWWGTACIQKSQKPWQSVRRKNIRYFPKIKTML